MCPGSCRHSRQRGLPRLLGCLEILMFRAIGRRRGLKSCDIIDQLLALLTELPRGGEVIGSPWYRPDVLNVRPNNAFLWVRHRGEKVCCCLTIGAVIAQVNEILLGLIRGAKVDLSTLVQDGDFVECLRNHVSRGVAAMYRGSGCSHHMQAGRLGTWPQ